MVMPSSDQRMEGSRPHLMEPVNVSVTAERLLHRSKTELEGEDYNLSIVIGVMAVESYLTRLALKFKGMDSYATAFELSMAAQEEEWEKEYPRSGGFSGPIGFLSKLEQRPSTSSLWGTPSQLRYFLTSRIPGTLTQRNTSRTNLSTDATGSLTGAT
jgi:hypothetical protein